MAGTDAAVRDAVIAQKRDFARRLTDTAREAGAADPESLGGQLAVLFEGAMALATSLDDPGPVQDAYAAAVTLVDAAVGRPAGQG